MKKVLIVLVSLALAASAGAQAFVNGGAMASVSTCADPLPLAQLTDSATQYLALVSGGPGEDPIYDLLPVASLDPACGTCTSDGPFVLLATTGGGAGVNWQDAVELTKQLTTGPPTPTEYDWAASLNGQTLTLTETIDSVLTNTMTLQQGVLTLAHVPSTSSAELTISGMSIMVDGNTVLDIYEGDIAAESIVIGSTAEAGAGGEDSSITGGKGGAALTDSDGNAGGVVEITGGEGSALNGSGTNDGSGGDLILMGGAKGGSNGTAVAGIVRIGGPTVSGTRTTDMLAVAGDVEVNGYLVAGMGISVWGGGDGIFGRAVSQGTAGTEVVIIGGVAGSANTDSDGMGGGDVALVGGEGSALDGAGSNDGNGGDVVFVGGEPGGATGTAVPGIVRVGTPTVASTRTTDLLAVGGGVEVDGVARFDGGISAGASAGLTTVVTVRDDAGTGTCTMTYTSGLLTATTCTHT